MSRRVPLELLPFGAQHVDGASGLLADRQRAQRRVEPGLAPAWEEVAACRTEIARLLGKDGASGAVAFRGDAMVGYLLGAPRGALWGPNTWVEGAGHAVVADDPELIRDLYGFAAARWVASGFVSHYAVVPATDPGAVDAWFRVGFGQQHVHAIRDVPGPGDTVEVPAHLRIRRAERRDIPTLGRLDLVLPEHQVLSPVFSRQQLQSLEDVVNEIEDEFDDPRFTTFVAEHDGLVIGSAVGCSIEESSEHQGIVRPERAGFLGFAAVLPEARGLGAGRALGEAVLAWSRDAGYRTVVTDWRETNLLSSRTWPRLGFRPTFRRLFRHIP